MVEIVYVCIFAEPQYVLGDQLTDSQMCATEVKLNQNHESAINAG